MGHPEASCWLHRAIGSADHKLIDAMLDVGAGHPFVTAKMDDSEHHHVVEGFQFFPHFLVEFHHDPGDGWGVNS